MDNEALRRWRLVLGAPQENKESFDGTNYQLEGDDVFIDEALSGLYDGEMTKGKGGSGKSNPKVHRWLGDIRKYFSTPVVQMMQKDAIDKLGLNSLLTEKEMLEQVVPDVHLVATLMELKGAIPESSKQTARLVVQKVVDELMKKLDQPMRAAITGALSRSIRKSNPRFREIDWNATIRKNLKHYQKDYKTIIPEERVGMGRKGQSLKDVVLCIDQSGSMGTSVVYSAIFGAVMASLPTVATKLVVFDTEVVDLTEQMSDPIDVLFGVQLGGGTHINKALQYCQSIITRPEDTVMVFISDLYEGASIDKMMARFKELYDAGVNVVVLLALSDDGASFYDKKAAQALANMGICAFACTPDLFPDLMGAALLKQDMSMWAAENISNTETNFLAK